MTVILFLALLATSSVADDLAVTIYNNNLGVISETRPLEFDKGVGRLAFRDVPYQINAASVRFEVIDADLKVAILEQNYAYDLVSPNSLYAKYIDQPIELITEQGTLYTGDLLAYANNTFTLRELSGRIKIIGMHNIVETSFPLLPAGLITRPTLFWEYESDKAGTFDCQVSYQTAGMEWQAEYVGILDSKETQLDLSGWASIDNKSGKTYIDAKLKLIAGDIHRAPRKEKYMRSMSSDGMATSAPRFQEKAFFEYHMYTLPRPATLANKETKQISLFEPATAGVEKVYYYRPHLNPTEVAVTIECVNSKETGLGMPLPAGRVRIFKADDDGSLILLGEDNVGHTPKDEEISLTIGNAFDIKATETMLSQTRISKLAEDRKFEIELRNHKTEDVLIRVEKRLWGIFEVTQSSHKYEKKDASTIAFAIPVGAESETKVTFTVRFTTR
jgi:hypothetical protein